MKKQHPAAIREWAVQQIVFPIGRSMTDVVSELGVTTEALRLWKRAFLSQLDSNDERRQCNPLLMTTRHAPAAAAVEGEGKLKRTRYTAAFREWAVAQMMPPLNQTVVELARQNRVTTFTLRVWQNAARAEGKIMARGRKPADRWSGSDKFGWSWKWPR